MLSRTFILTAFGLILITGLPGCQSVLESDQNQSEVQVSPERFSRVVAVREFQVAMREDGAQIIDVRTDGEVSQGYIEGAQQMDISDWDAFTDAVSTLDKTKPVLLYCAAGGRSGRASAYFQELGFTQIYDLKGGMNAWMAADGELVK